MMNQLSIKKQVEVLKHLVEGCSIRATVRLTGVAKNTIKKLIYEVGRASHNYQHEEVKFTCEVLQVDELWSFVYCKERNLDKSVKKDLLYYGDVYTWVAICPKTRFVPTYLVGKRNEVHALAFMAHLKHKIGNKRIQLTSDGFKPYLSAVKTFFGSSIDFATLVKLHPEEGNKRNLIVGIDKRTVSGHPDTKRISTSYCERQNATMRMSIRRFARDVFAFSKCPDQHKSAVAIHFMWYNFVRIHQTLKTTPAIAAGVTDHVWSFEEMLKLCTNYLNKETYIDI